MKFDIKNIRKEYLVLLASIIIIVMVAVFSRDIVRIWHEMNVDMECVEERQIELNQDYNKGYVVVKFKENFTENEIRNLINQYGLFIENVKSISRVYVTEGNEIKWLCILEKSDLIEYVVLSGGTGYLGE